MSHLRVCAAWCVPWLAVQCLFASALQSIPGGTVNSVKPLQTELIAPLDISHIHLGSPVLVRVDLEWAGLGCTLRAGSIIQGHVVEITKRSKGVKDSVLQLAFDAADCEAHHENSFPFTLVAVVGFEGGTSSPGQSGVSEAPPLADALGNEIGGPRGGFRSVSSASAINSAFSTPIRQLPSQISPGAVLGVRKTVLSVGTGEQGATVIKAFGRDLRLEQGTSLILTHRVLSENAIAKATFPARGTEMTAARPGALSVSATGGGGSEMVATGFLRAENANAPTHPAILFPVPEIPDETNICTATCNVVDGFGSGAKIQDSTAIASIPLTKLGYLPRNKREIDTFNHDTTLTYLDSHTLLCTFDPHMLRERAGLDQDGVRRVKAVLVDTETHSIKRVMEWRVQGDEQYLWHLTEGKILVHMGRELREFDSQLKTFHSIPLEGKVAWAVASPSGDYIAVGIVRERYSAAVQHELEAVLSDSPEEDIEVRVVDKDRTLLFTAIQSSKLPPPVLSDSGEFRLHGDVHTHWKISEYRWDRTEHRIATTTSACRPLLSTPAHGLIFVVGCTSSGGTWYRMLRSDGHPLLKGESASDEILQYAQGTAGGDFAVRTVKAVHSMSYGQPFRRADLAQERITVYRNQDGAHLASVATADFAMSQLAFALSPNGDQMAVIGDSSILFYPTHLHRN